MMPVLLFAYLNYEGTKNRITELNNNGFKEIYVFLDGYTQTADKYEVDQRSNLVNFLNDCKTEGKILYLNQSRENLGVGNAVPYALDWFFANFEIGLILEDDCRLIDFTKDKANIFKTVLSNHPNSIICLSTPKVINADKNSLRLVEFLETSFFSSWGWICNRVVWQNNRVRTISLLEVTIAALKISNISVRRKVLLLVSWSDIWRKLRKNQNKLWAFRFSVLVILNQTKILFPKFKTAQHEPSCSGTNVKFQPVWDQPIKIDSKSQQIGDEFIVYPSSELADYQAIHTHGANFISISKRNIYALAKFIRIK
jgi:hypothetical protein